MIFEVNEVVARNEMKLFTFRGFVTKFKQISVEFLIFDIFESSIDINKWRELRFTNKNNRLRSWLIKLARFVIMENNFSI
jgi:hypothetical protein